jgi:hypothetical protein
MTVIFALNIAGLDSVEGLPWEGMGPGPNYFEAAQLLPASWNRSNLASRKLLLYFCGKS